MTAGQKTAQEVEAQCVELIKQGKTRRQVSEETGVSARVLTRIARDAGVEWARVGQGSSGTPEAAAKARGVQSEYARNRRATLSERILDATEKTLELLETCSLPRERQYLSQALRNHTAAYADLTANDAKAAPDMTQIGSSLDRIFDDIGSRQIVEVRAGMITG